MDYMTTKEASAKWGYSEATIRKWSREENCLLFAKKNGRWQMPNALSL